MKRKRCWIVGLSLGASIGLGLVGTNTSAQADGFDPPSGNSGYFSNMPEFSEYSENFLYPESFGHTTNSQFRNQRFSRSDLNWASWSAPQLQNDSICRENNGNVICLSPESARNMRW